MNLVIWRKFANDIQLQGSLLVMDNLGHPTAAELKRAVIRTRFMRRNLAEDYQYCGKRRQIILPTVMRLCIFLTKSILLAISTNIGFFSAYDLQKRACIGSFMLQRGSRWLTKAQHQANEIFAVLGGRGATSMK